MPTVWKEYFRPLDEAEPDGERLRIRIRTERGNVTDFVVQYETPNLYGEDPHIPVVRYDGSHGTAHRDVLDAAGRSLVMHKHWLSEDMLFADALTFAIRDLAANWIRYKTDFLQRRRTS